MGRPHLAAGVMRLAAAAATFAATAVAVVQLPPALSEPPRLGPRWTDRHGTDLRLARDGASDQRPIALHHISASLVRATLAAEDRRFWWHPGLDPLAIARALTVDRAAGLISGASTVSQQLVKIAHQPPRPRSLRSKCLETLQAFQLEARWSKEAILESYLNRLDYGNLAVGCEAAAQFYFGRSAAALSPAQAAFLAALPKAPSRLNPHRHFFRAQHRQRRILDRMETLGWLDQEAARRARGEPLILEPPDRAFEAPHFVDWLIDSGPPAPSAHGPFRTTLDLPLTRWIEHRLAGHLARLRAKHVRHGAVIVLENATGELLAWVGSGDFQDPRSGQVNGAWVPRSPGSALKPFLYAMAFERHWHPGAVLPDIPAAYPTPTGLFRPVNFDRRFRGPVSLRGALASSLNVPAVRLLHELGGPAPFAERLASCGFTTLGSDPERFGLGLCLGNAEVRLLELAQAFACLARLGLWRPLRVWRDQAPEPERRVFDPRACFLVADILSDNHARAPAFGVASRLRFPYPVACKTGTSTSFRDNWAVAYTPQHCVAVWMGNFDNAPMRGVSGVAGAAPLMHEIVEHLHAASGAPTWFAPPPEIARVWLEPLTGRQLPAGAHGAVADLALPGSQMMPFRPHDRAADGRIQLPAEYGPWLAREGRSLATRAVAAPSDEPDILTPPAGAVFVLDPDLPDDARWAEVESLGGDAIRWSSDSLRFERRGARTFVELRPGRHILRATDPATGRSAERRVDVRTLR